MATKPPKNPEYLYKFRGVSNLRWLIDILIHERLYAASYDELNDPMEGYFLFDSSTNAIVRKKLREKRKKTRICSLSKNYTNTLMWSYYAEDHKGICIKLAVTSSSWRREEIKYEDKLPVLTDNPHEYYGLLGTKSKLWEKEEEVRYIKVFDNQDKMRKGSFIKIYIDSIYLGYRMSKNDVAFYTKLFQSLLPFLPKENIRKLSKDEINTGFVNVS